MQVEHAAEFMPMCNNMLAIEKPLKKNQSLSDVQDSEVFSAAPKNGVFTVPKGAHTS